MYVSFPKEYFVEVNTMADFEYNYIGKPIECNNVKMKKDENRVVYDVSEDNKEFLKNIDEEYVQSEILK